MATAEIWQVRPFQFSVPLRLPSASCETIEIDHGAVVVLPDPGVVDPVPASCVGSFSSSAPADGATQQLKDEQRGQCGQSHRTALPGTCQKNAKPAMVAGVHRLHGILRPGRMLRWCPEEDSNLHSVATART